MTQLTQPERAYPAVEPGAAARAVLRQATGLRAAIAQAQMAPHATRQAARASYEAMRAGVTRRELDTMPLERVKGITKERLRLGALEKAGYRTVGSVLAASPYMLDAIPGVGPDTVRGVTAAARQLQLAMEGQTRIRLDPDARAPEQTALLAGLRAYEAAKTLVPPQGPDLGPLAADIDAVLGPAKRTSNQLKMFFTFSSRKKQDSREALARLVTILQSQYVQDVGRSIAAAQQASQRQYPDWLWSDYLARPVVYNGLLIEVAELAPDREASQGYLPVDLAERVHRFPIDLSLMTTSLRGYQAFGAKFGLVQEKVIIGDEMGLGKTIQALAAMCHVAAGGARHFLVVCPASVVVNWTREVRQHTKLEPYRLHGLDRRQDERSWSRNGGVAITTYEVLRTAPPMDVELGMLVVDEAHYAKNPAAKRTLAVRRHTMSTRRVIFLSGTPMENRVEEFRVLVSHLRPDVAVGVREVDGVLGGTRFRQAVAPVYLRRNQEDVLQELPERLETQDWVELDGPALAAYTEAVFAGNFMAMRRAAYLPGTVGGSAKLARLAEIVGEATEDGRKVVVFSFFRDVLTIVARTLGGLAVGPITGDVPASARQALVDEFSARRDPAVLVAQINAGGVGLNIQAASVVILAEPQMTPAIEEQAIARAHRMGQVRRVDVHRLLAENSVDARMLELLHSKRVAFDEYARRSDLADSTPDAVDITDLADVKETAKEAEKQRRMIEIEQKRLRAEAKGGAGGS